MVPNHQPDNPIIDPIIWKVIKFMLETTKQFSHMLHVWYIYLHLGEF